VRDGGIAKLVPCCRRRHLQRPTYDRARLPTGERHLMGKGECLTGRHVTLPAMTIDLTDR
jgi:hypothetical protein